MNKKTTGLMLLVVAAVVLAGYWYFRQQQVVQMPPPPVQMTVAQKKARFRALLVPAVDDVYCRLLRQYRRVKRQLENGESNARIAALKKQYRANSDTELLAALKPHPRSIALAQAALESNWATSRFFWQANNIFGVWSFDPNEPRLAAGRKRGDKTIYVKKYPSISAAIEDYYLLLGRGSAFREFRRARLETDDPFVLVYKLDKYSERGKEYCDEVAAVIRHNNFDQYDREEVK